MSQKKFSKIISTLIQSHLKFRRTRINNLLVNIVSSEISYSNAKLMAFDLVKVINITTMFIYANKQIFS